MGLIENENKVFLGFKGVLVIILAILAFLSIPAFSNDYPALAWLCLSIDGLVICVWLCLAGHGNKVVYTFLALSALILIAAFVFGVQSEWNRLTGKPKQTIPTQQEIQPITYILECLQSFQIHSTT